LATSPLISFFWSGRRDLNSRLSNENHITVERKQSSGRNWFLFDVLIRRGQTKYSGIGHVPVDGNQ